MRPAPSPTLSVPGLLARIVELSGLVIKWNPSGDLLYPSTTPTKSVLKPFYTSHTSSTHSLHSRWLDLRISHPTSVDSLDRRSLRSEVFTRVSLGLVLVRVRCMVASTRGLGMGKRYADESDGLGLGYGACTGGCDGWRYRDHEIQIRWNKDS